MISLSGGNQMNNSSARNYKLQDDPIIRFCSFYAFLYIGSLILGGTGIFLIVFGLMFFFTRVFARTPTGQTYIRRFFNLNQPNQVAIQTHSRFYQIITTSFRLLLFGAYIFASIFVIWMGMRMLFDDGFLNQNLI